ncbi:MAG: thiol reductase thioredoxin [Calditrichaeota bacterium]|nr:MAG: thiol reductase thioredoxin [Calditrichota bacterium]
MTTLPHVSEPTFDPEVLKFDLPVLAVFVAEWSTASKKQLADLAPLAAAHADRLKVVEIDIDDNPTIVSRYRILQAPTLLLFKNGLEVARLTGPAAPDRIEEMIAPFLKR